jgi:hypothetical protein
MGNGNGEEGDYKAPAVDEGRLADPEDARAREKTKTTVIARKLRRTVGATYQKASALGVKLGEGRRKKRA